MDERQLTAPPPIGPPDEPEVEIEGPERSDHDVEMTDAAAMRATGEGEAADGPIDADEKTHFESQNVIAGKRRVVETCRQHRVLQHSW